MITKCFFIDEMLYPGFLEMTLDVIAMCVPCFIDVEEVYDTVVTIKCREADLPFVVRNMAPLC